MRLFRTVTIAAGATLLLGGLLTQPAAAGLAHYRIVDLGTLGGAFSFASAVNAHGDVTGQSQDANGTLRPFRWHDGKLIDLGVSGWLAVTWLVGRNPRDGR
jgi:probable HAF family extracellular repeat protein